MTSVSAFLIGTGLEMLNGCSMGAELGYIILLSIALTALIELFLGD